MLRFENSDYLWGLLLVPCFALLFWAVARWKKRAFAALGDQHVTQNMVPEVACSRPRLKFVFFAAAYALLVVAATAPTVARAASILMRRRATFGASQRGSSDAPPEGTGEAELA